MKYRTFIFYICLILPLIGKAQILKDSTINTIAYWNMGEKYKYSYQTNEYTVEGNDTIWGDTSEEEFVLEVVDSTATGYVLKYQALKSKHDMKDKEAQKILEPLMQKYMDVPLYIATNEYGTFQDLAYWDKTQAVVDTMISEVLDTFKAHWAQEGLTEGIEEAEKKQIEAVLENMSATMKSKQMTLAGASYLTDLLYFHGTHMSQNHEYTGTQQSKSPWTTDELIDVETTAQIHRVEYDNSWVTYYRTQRYDAGQLLEGFMRQMQKSLPPEQVQELTPEDIPFVMIETFLDLDVHTNTGWPGAAFFKKVSQVGQRQQVKTWYVEMIFDE